MRQRSFYPSNVLGRRLTPCCPRAQYTHIRTDLPTSSRKETEPSCAPWGAHFSAHKYAHKFRHTTLGSSLAQENFLSTRSPAGRARQHLPGTLVYTRQPWITKGGAAFAGTPGNRRFTAFSGVPGLLPAGFFMTAAIFSGAAAGRFRAAPLPLPWPGGVLLSGGSMAQLPTFVLAETLRKISRAS